MKCGVGVRKHWEHGVACVTLIAEGAENLSLWLMIGLICGL
jgi:hypothetical protein